MTPLAYLKDKQIYVVGLARSGQATVEALEKAGAIVYTYDDGQPGGTAPADAPWSTLTALVLSPGIPHRFPEPHPAASLAEQHGVPIVCDVDLLVQARPDATYVAITGTNGKSTTTALVHHLLPDAVMGGNIGIPVLAVALTSPSSSLFVLELSSYQLERVPNLKADVAVWTNITPDHLDRHGDMAGYVAAKKNVFKPWGEKQTIVMGIDDAYSRAVYHDLVKDAAKTVIPVQRGTRQAQGLSIESGLLFDDGIEVRDLTSASVLRGAHNHQNIALAYGVLKALKREFPWQRLGAFTGLAHRQEVIRSLGNVVYINDSKATNIESTLTALKSYNDIYLLAGGVAKENGLQGIDGMRDRLRQVYVYGQAAQRFSETLTDLSIPHSCYETLAQALEAAHGDAQRASLNATVLLSPACASFDQYKDFEARGEAFREAVLSLKPIKGVSHG